MRKGTTDRIVYNLRKRVSSAVSKPAMAQRQLIEAPKFVKHGNAPILTRTMASWVGGSQIYFPSPIYMGAVENRVYKDPFYLYYSTDHASGEGGIGLATAPSPVGPYTDRGKVFSDTTFGEQTETPEVVYNEKTGKIHLYYHQNYYAAGDTSVYQSQATCLALSDNGVNFTIHKNPLITVPDGEFPGDGHTGYARVYRMGDLWIMRHSMGGTDYSHNGLSYSRDGIQWVTDPRPVIGNAEWASDGVDRKIGVNGVFKWRGRYWANVNDNAWVSGVGDAPSINYVSPYFDPRFPGEGLFEAVKIGGAGAWDEKSVRNISIMEYEERLYLFYEGVSASGVNAFGVAVGEV